MKKKQEKLYLTEQRPDIPWIHLRSSGLVRIWSLGRRQHLFFCGFSHFWHGHEQPNNRVILVQACSWPVRRQSFAKSKPTYIPMFDIEKALLHPPCESFSCWQYKNKNAATKIMHISTILLGISWKVACCKKCIILTPFARSPFPSLIWGYLLFHFFVWLKK